LDPPELDFQPAECVEIRPFRLTPRPLLSPCTVGKDEAQQRQRAFNEVVAQLSAIHPRLRVFDPTPLFCDDRTCVVSREGRMLYTDKHHLNLIGSRMIAPVFLRWLARQES